MILKSSMPIRLALAGVLVSLVAACASQGPTDNPIQRKLSWFSYMEGDDLRAACKVGGADQYRLVYNGVYMEQVRTYDIHADGLMDVRILEPADIRHFSVSSLSGLLDPWRGKTASLPLTRTELETLVSALAVDGAFGPPAVGTELSSRGFFWTIAACHQGSYHFTGLAWPSAGWEAATFDDVLFALDPSAIPVNPPRWTRTSQVSAHRPDKTVDVQFQTKVGPDGLVGSITPFQ